LRRRRSRVTLAGVSKRRRRRKSDLHPLLGIPAFLAGIALAMPIVVLIDRALPGAHDGPALVLPYICCAFAPCIAFTLAIASRIQRALVGQPEPPPPAAFTGFGARPRVEEDEGEPLLDGRSLLVIGLVLAVVAGIGYRQLRSANAPTAPSGPSTPPPAVELDPAERARTIARAEVVRRLSSAGVDKMVLDARRITRGGTRYWRVTTRGAIADLVVDVADDAKVGIVFDAASAPPPDVDGVEAVEGVAPVHS
jgi:hypothetical protein